MAKVRRQKSRQLTRSVKHRSKRYRAVTERVSARDTIIMAVVAVGFIAAFGFALSKRPSHAAFQPPMIDTAVEYPHTAGVPEGLNTNPSAPSYSDGETGVPDRSTGADDFDCLDARVTDGDTIRCGALRVRLASIDAPEMPGHCRSGRTCVEGDPFASKASLERLMAAGAARCHPTDTDRYGRIVAFCSVAGQDLSCAQVQGGHAIIRYGDLSCPTA
jgi:endonuclease YncB( thermonuclease family)